MEHFLYIIIGVLTGEPVLQQLAQMEAHCTCEVDAVQLGSLNVGVVFEEVVEGAFAAKHRRKEVQVLEHVPAEGAGTGVVAALEDVFHSFLSPSAADFLISFFFAYLLIVPRV